MSIHSVKQYQSEVEKIIQFGGTKKETAIRNAFYNLLNEYAKQKGLILIPEITIKTSKGKNITPDGTLKDSLRLDWGYWESKDEADDIDEEIEKKFNKGYPKENILFEDSKTAILIQQENEAMRISMKDADALDRIIKEFINYERPEVRNFHKAIELFKQDIPNVTSVLRGIIIAQEKTNIKFTEAENKFWELCKVSINPELSIDDVREMMIQHILTEDIFNTIFGETQFHRENNIAHELEQVILTFFTGNTKHIALGTIQHYYQAINAAAAQIADHHEKQKFLKVVYEIFYKSYNPKAADRLGVVYTPNEIVQFMIESTDYLLYHHFGKGLEDQGVEILDPATGTGTFICDIIDYIRKDKLPFKYETEIHANEIAILPYYIANLNIEFTYKQKTGEYNEFKNLCFVDTLDNLGFGYSNKNLEHGLWSVSAENAERIKRQNKRKISVIIGNPPYNANQANENDNNKNRTYPNIDKKIKDSFAKNSNASNKANLYDMYVRFFRWSFDRLSENGILAFITNNSYLNAKAFDGFRKSIQNEFQFAYIIDLGGNIRELSGKDGIFLNENHTIFGQAAAVGISIAFLVKDKNCKNQNCIIKYIHPTDIRATRDEKLEYLANHKFDDISFNVIIPDIKNNWINNSDNDFYSLIPICDDKVKEGHSEKAVFKLYSLGINTNRDEWVYDFDKSNLSNKMQYFIKTYNEIVDKNDSTFPNTIKWSSSLKNYFERKIKGKYKEINIKETYFRPFVKVYHYTEKIFNHRLTELHYKSFGHSLNQKNLLISFNVNTKGFFVLSCNTLLDLHFTGDGQFVPFYQYDEHDQTFSNITDWGLQQFWEHYKDKKITKRGHITLHLCSIA